MDGYVNLCKISSKSTQDDDVDDHHQDNDADNDH